MRKTRSKTHKRHAKRHTRRRGGEGNNNKNASGGPANNKKESTLKPEIKLPNELVGAPRRFYPPLVTPYNTPYGNDGPGAYASFFKKGNTGYPRGTKPVLKERIRQMMGKRQAEEAEAAFALPGSSAALAAAPKGNGPFSGAPLARQPANKGKGMPNLFEPVPKGKVSKVVPMAAAAAAMANGSPFSPTSGY
jgi:hypothetical protein